MKSNCMFSLLLLLVICTPDAEAKTANSVMKKKAINSRATTGKRGWRTSKTGHQATPGNSIRTDAGEGKTFTTALNVSLPTVCTGLNAPTSFAQAPVRQFGNGGFSGGGYRDLTLYGGRKTGIMLPPTAMTPCDLTVAEVSVTPPRGTTAKKGEVFSSIGDAELGEWKP